MTISLTHLRADLYNIVDQVIKTNTPVEVKRHGQMVRIVPVEPRSRLANLTPHPGTIIGDPEDIVHMDWSNEWKQGKTE